MKDEARKARLALTARQAQQGADRADLGTAWADTGLVFTTRTGRPVEPRNLVRSFIRLCDQNGIRKIRVHMLRHTAASLLKDLHVAARVEGAGQRIMRLAAA